MDAIRIAGQSADPAIVTDERDRILGWNPAAEGLFGLQRPGGLGRPLGRALGADAWPGDREGSGPSALVGMLRRGGLRGGFRVRARSVRGRSLLLGVSVVVVVGRDSAVRHVYVLHPEREPASARTWPEPPTPRAGAIRLTPRQLQVLGLLVEGRNAEQIAGELGVSVHTIRSHIQNIFASLGVRSQLQAVSVAVRGGLVRAPREM